ncbi:MAG: apolipoprotein N-acyltransferase [Desulfobacterales bacterium]|nr:apolipoprotein N-acyltransferase [Desulfobacterales bacterium]
MDIGKIKLSAAVLSGLLLAGSFPKIGIPQLAWFALAPLLVSIQNLSFRNSFRLGFLCGLVHYLVLMYWLVYTMMTYGHLPLYVSIVVLILLSAYLALYTALFAALLSRLCRTSAGWIVMGPVLWVSLEYVRSFLLSGFPWELLGYSQFALLPLIQVSDLTGVYGISFIIVAANAVVSRMVSCLAGIRLQEEKAVATTWALAAVFALSIVLSAVWFYGKWRMEKIDGLLAAAPKTRITIVQGNIDQAIKWDPAHQVQTLEKYIGLSSPARTGPTDLVVWPETATPFYFLHHRDLTEMVLQSVRRAATAFLIGSPSFTQDRNAVNYYNSAYLISPQGRVLGKYDKAHLVPFGEYVPFKKWLPFLGKIVQEVGDFKPGKKGSTLRLGDLRLGLQICFEIIFPGLSRSMADNNAGLLINLTNDAWFAKTSGPYQHFSMAVFRAVENRKTLVRAANTGISGFVDPAGRIMAATPLFQEASLTRPVSILTEKTFYTRFGDLFAILCLITTALLALRARKNKLTSGLTANR